MDSDGDHYGDDSDYSILSDIFDQPGSFDEDGVDTGSDYSVRSDALELGSNESSGEDDDSDYSIRSDALELSSAPDGSSDVDSDLDLDSDLSIRSDIYETGLNSSYAASGENDVTSSSFTNLSLDDRFLKPLYDGAKLSVFESYSLLLQHSLRHSLTKRAFSDLLQLVGQHLPTGSMASLYKVKKFFLDLYGDITFKLCHCCSCCHSLLEDSETTCRNSCNEAGVVEFLSIPISNQLKRRLEDSSTWSNLQKRFEHVSDSGELCDVYDGREYRQHLNFLSKPENVSLLLNTDGVSVFRSSTVSLWPLWLVINELPPSVRFSKENMLLAGLWFGREKPTMTTYMYPLMKELKQLADIGISVNSPHGTVTSKAKLLMCTVDLPARAQILNMKQYNGKQGCAYCEDEGTPRPSSHLQRNWLYSNDRIQRTHQKMRADAKTAAEEGDVVNGIKGASILSAHKSFKLPTGVVIDVMHCIFLGVVNALMAMWFGVGHRGKPFSIRNKMKQCNEHLSLIRVPHDFSRMVRGLDDLKQWKASEYRSWLLYYSLPVIHGVLPEPFFTHYTLLVAALHILLSTSISQSNLRRATRYLDRFYENFSALYGEDGCTMNVHLLCHLPDCVLDWGPLWCYSCFPFESVNGRLKTYYHGTRCMNKQLGFSYIMLQLLPKRTEKEPKRIPLADCCALGKIQVLRLETEVQDKLKEEFGVNLETGRKFLRAHIKGRVYHSMEYRRMKKRNSYTVCYSTDDVEKFGFVRYFISLSGSTVAVLSRLVPSSHYCYPPELSILQSRVIPVTAADDIDIISVSFIVSKCVVIDLDGSMYIARLPNNLYAD